MDYYYLDAVDMCRMFYIRRRKRAGSLRCRQVFTMPWTIFPIKDSLTVLTSHHAMVQPYDTDQCGCKTIVVSPEGTSHGAPRMIEKTEAVFRVGRLVLCSALLYATSCRVGQQWILIRLDQARSAFTGTVGDVILRQSPQY